MVRKNNGKSVLISQDTHDFVGILAKEYGVSRKYLVETILNAYFYLDDKSRSNFYRSGQAIVLMKTNKIYGSNMYRLNGKLHRVHVIARENLFSIINKINEVRHLR